MSSLVIDWAKANWESINFHDRQIIYRDLKQEFESSRSLGDDCDVQSWRSFLEWMEQGNQKQE